MYEGKVRMKSLGFLSFALAPIVGVGMIGFIFWFMVKTTQWFFWVPVVCAILLALKSGLLGLLSDVLNPHEFTITHNGLISKEGRLILWPQIKEVVFFNHGGYQHMGIKLRETESSVAGKPVGEALRNNLNWVVYKMPIVTMSDHLDPSQQELVRIFKDDYRVAVRFMEKEIEIGREGEL
jgi:hypothetical protein